jgi:hypothetical protein
MTTARQSAPAGTRARHADHDTTTSSCHTQQCTCIECEDRYADRAATGRRLAELLFRYQGGRALVLALPPGGVAVAGELARVLRLPLEVLVARDLVVHPYPAVVVGALSEGGGLYLNFSGSLDANDAPQAMRTQLHPNRVASSGRWSNTGVQAPRTTLSATLPSNKRDMPPRPCVAIAIRSTPCSRA